MRLLKRKKKIEDVEWKLTEKGRKLLELLRKSQMNGENKTFEDLMREVDNAPQEVV